MKRPILIIDDSAQFLELAKATLSQKGYPDVLLAQTVDEGLKIINEQRPRLVIIDALMPGKNGFEACRQIRNLLKEEVKLLMLTGDVSMINARLSRESGADDITVKTSDQTELLEKIETLLA